MMKRTQRRTHNDRRGMTLVELMIAITIFGIIMGVVFGFMVETRDSYDDTRNRVQYQQSVRAVISLMTREVRSAGCDPDQVGFDAFALADDDQMRCRMDLNGDGDATDNQPDEDITYTFDVGNQALVRNVGAGDQVILRNVQNITFAYFDDQGNALNTLPLNATDRALVQYVEVTISGESDDGEPVNYSTRILVRNG